MTQEEFHNKRFLIKQELNKLEVDYAISLSKFSIGDIIQRKDCIIKIDSITACRRHSNDPLPIVIYRGKQLTKQKNLRKDNKISTIAEDLLLKL